MCSDFGGIAGAATCIAKIVFFTFLVIFVISLITGQNPKPISVKDSVIFTNINLNYFNEDKTP